MIQLQIQNQIFIAGLGRTRGPTPPPTEEERITEDSETRLTEAGETRIIE
jgi:hypothetical protein